MNEEQEAEILRLGLLNERLIKALKDIVIRSEGDDVYLASDIRNLALHSIEES